jgi:hypothetical protein
MTAGQTENTPNEGNILLTRIRDAYTLFDTPEPDSNETESLIVKNFLDTLAEVTIAIASRMKCKGEDQR